MPSENTLMLEQMHKLNEIGIALSAERDTSRLLEEILSGAMVLSNADAGTIYTVTEAGQLYFEVLANNSLAIVPGQIAEATFEPIPLFDPETGVPNTSTVVTSVVHRRKAINITDVYGEHEFDFSGTHSFDEKSGYHTKSLLTIPMMNHENDIIGVLQLINCMDEESGQVQSFDQEKQHLAESLASQAAVALTNKRLIDDLNDLFEAFIKLIATAIDDKSPYTGGHCRRVPELTMMLAEAASQSSVGSLMDFQLDEDSRHELNVAAWLHDCGKITTPEYVMDKATKLETIYDRIHEIELRFELMKKDREVEVLREKLDRLKVGQSTEDLDKAFEQQCRLWDEERDFLRQSNVGGEYMDESKQQRVRDIGSQSYMSSDGVRKILLSDDEIENLIISKGTLTDEERNVINHHIVATIKMLESLPFPKHLKNVPEYAGGHHERMDGRGYPRGLTREQMSVPARVMAIADIFEALTAEDRPYKKGKKLSECLRIMGFMKEDNHIDAELFKVFIDDKIYMRYAQEFLHQEQIDEIDPAQIPGYQ
jgi:HD-GYP domain-containing protein (c-di-GMP phosphodiesterase class II)